MATRTRLTICSAALFTIAVASALGACGTQKSDDAREGSGVRASSGPVIALASSIARSDTRLSTVFSKQGGLVAREGAFRSLVADGPARDLSVVASHAADGATLLTLAGGVVTLKARGASAVEGVLENGMLVYPSAYPGVDRIAATENSAHEELFVLHTAAAASAFEWDVDLAPGIRSARSDGHGGLSFVDAEGESVLHIPEPYAIDSKGTKSIATLSWDGVKHRLAVTLANAVALSYPVLLDPAFEVYVWQKKGVPYAAPTVAMAYDSARGRNVMVAAGVTWTSNGQPWTRASDAGPSGRDLTAMAYDSFRGKTVLFGGLDGAASAATWEWDGKDWAQFFSATVPSARYGHAMAFDPVRNTVVMFGGTTGAGDKLSDTWEWDGKTWTQIVVAGPTGRAGHAMALDAVRKKIVLFGGGTITGKAMTAVDAETWEWDGAAWTKITAATNPSARGLSAVTFDTNRKKVALYGGESAAGVKSNEYWEWDGTNWASIAMPVTRPSARSGSALSYDPVRLASVLFGGNGADVSTWSWNATAWSTLGGTDPGSRHFPNVVYDSVRKKVVLFGGSTPVFAKPIATDIWEWDGSGWKASAVAMPIGSGCRGTPYFNAPICDGLTYCSNGAVVFCSVGTADILGNMWFDSAQRFGAATAFDAKRGETVMFGGTLYNPTGNVSALVGFSVAGIGNPANAGFEANTVQHVNDTWTFNGSAWTKKSAGIQGVVTGTAPAKRREAAMVFVPGIDKVILFGGAGQYVTAYDDTWSWNGTTWAAIAPTGGVKPPARGSHAMTYDAFRQRIVMFGGSLSTGFSDWKNDTWEFNPATNTWTQMSPASSPPADAFPALEYDPIHKVSVLFSADASSVSGSLRTWTWNGTTWSDITPSSAPALRRGARVVYDAERKQFVMAGGADPLTGGTAIGETWTLHTRGRACVANSDCETGFCTDGVCCEAPSCGSCEACDVSGSVGTCAKVRGTTDADSCTGTKTCDLTGSCKAVLGQSCSAASGCASGFCVDGVCCDTECKGSCQACSAALTVAGVSGTCGATKAGVDPRNDCAAEDVATCGRDGQCDGKGGCELVGNGVSCATATKLSACSGNRAVGWVCNGLGSCGNTVDGTDCDPYVCNLATGGCTDSCVRDVDCISTYRCDGTTKKCVVKAAYCKDEDTVIDVNGKETACAPFKCSAGRCVTVTACKEDGHTLLQADGTTKDCAPFTCSGDRCVTVTACQADGHTLLQEDGTTKDCAPFECSGDRCVEVTACKSDGRTLLKADGTTQDCAPFLCIGNRCANVNACQADGHTLLKEDGTTVDCAPFACAGTACVEKCGSLAQCATPNVCGADGTCVAPNQENNGGGDDGGGCGCVTAPSKGTSSNVLGFAASLGFAVAAARRRKRARL